MGVLAIMIRGIRISGLLFVMVRKLLVLNVTPGTWGAEWEESNKSLPLVVMWHKCIMVMFLYLIAVSDHNTTMTAGLLQMWRSYYIDTTAVVEVEGIHEIIISGGCSCRVNCIAYDQ